MTIISEFTGSPAIPELGLKTVDLKLEVHSFRTDFRDLQTLDRIFRPIFGSGTRVYRGISCCSAGLKSKYLYEVPILQNCCSYNCCSYNYMYDTTERLQSVDVDVL